MPRCPFPTFSLFLVLFLSLSSGSFFPGKRRTSKMMMPMMTDLPEQQDHRIHHGYLYSDTNVAPLVAPATTHPAKRLKTNSSASMSFPKEKKDGIGERVAALQQLVSPFGKTDTASVLLEATEYIKFLHDQLQVLSTPYLRANTGGDVQDVANYFSLRGRGLHLVPIASAGRIVGSSSNGADLWAPTNAGKINYKLYLAAGQM